MAALLCSPRPPETGAAGPLYTSAPRRRRSALAVAESASVAERAHRLRRREEVALREVDADPRELIEHRLALDTLGNREDAERGAHLADRLDHAAVHGVLGNVADELTID